MVFVGREELAKHLFNILAPLDPVAPRTGKVAACRNSRPVPRHRRG